MATYKARKKNRDRRLRPLDLSEASDYLNVTERWLRRAVAERRISYVKLGRLLRFNLDDLDAYLEAARVERRP